MIRLDDHAKMISYNGDKLSNLPQVERIPDDIRRDIRIVASVLPFKLNNYVVENLIDWSRVPDDPMFRLTFPHRDMLAPEDYNTIAALIENGASNREVKQAADEIRVRASRGAPRNLHALWDGALGKSIAWQELAELSQRLERDQGVPNLPTSADPINFANWAEQGRALAREAVYTSELRRRLAVQSSRGEVPDFRPDDAYLERMRAQSRSQIVLAARRAVRVLATLERR